MSQRVNLLCKVKRERSRSESESAAENDLDDLWIGVKGQSNPVIAGSPRNILRYSLRDCLSEVKH